MINFDTMILNDSTFVDYSKHHYDNKQCININEFFSDLKRFQYLDRLFKRYYKSGELNDRLILNHLIIIVNLFGVQVAKELLIFKIQPEHHSILMTFLYFLSYIEKDEIPSGVELNNIVYDKLLNI